MEQHIYAESAEIEASGTVRIRTLGAGNSDSRTDDNAKRTQLSRLPKTVNSCSMSVLDGSRATSLRTTQVLVLQISHDRIGKPAPSANPAFAWESFA